MREDLMKLLLINGCQIKLASKLIFLPGKNPRPIQTSAKDGSYCACMTQFLARKIRLNFFQNSESLLLLGAGRSIEIRTSIHTYLQHAIITHNSRVNYWV
jgi:hypothetical protein